MKNLSLILITFLALALFSCRKEESKLNNGQLTITASQQSSSDLKTNIGAPGTYEVTWNSADELALFDGSGNKNMPFALSSGFDSKSATFIGTIDDWTSGSRTFYAVYPYHPANGSADYTAYPLTIPQTQNQDFTSGYTYYHLGLYDYMAAPPKTIEYAGKSTLADDFSFEHLMAVLDIEVTNSTLHDIKVLQIRIKRSGNDFTATAKLDLSKSPGVDGFYEPLTYTNQLILTVQNAGTTANNTTFTGSMIIAPANLTAVNTDFEVSVLNAGGQGELYTVAKGTALNIERGKRYKAQVTIDAASLTQLPYESKNYHLIGIGTQVWMAENLAYLPSVVGPADISTSEARYYVNGYDGTDKDVAKTTDNYKTYGVLYNWPAAMNGYASSTSVPSGVQGICPAGWHLPSDAEWSILTTFLDGESVAGGKLKETGTSHWSSASAGATNSSGFTALPGGNSYNGGFLNPRGYAFFWSASKDGASNAMYRYLNASNDVMIQTYDPLGRGFSVRCLRNN